MKLAVAILLACVAIPQACGFSFPSFENIGSNEALENIREAGKQIIEKAGRQVETIRETVQKKKESMQEPSEKLTEMWRELQEKAGEKQKSWKEQKGKMKEMWKDLKQKAGEHKEELKKMWKENKESLRDQTEEKWLKFKSLVVEHLEEAKLGIDGLEEKLAAKIPEKPWKAMKEMRWRTKDITDKILALKEVFKMKLRELKTEELEPTTEGEEGEEQLPEVPEEPYTEEPYTDEPEPTTPYTPEEIPYTPEEIPDKVVPSEIPWTPAPEQLTTAYPEEDLDGDEDWSSVDQGVLSDEDETPEESEEESPDEEDGEEEEEELPEEPVEEEGDEDEEEGDNDEEEEEEGDGAVEGESSAQATEKKSPMTLFSKIMSERRNRMKQWFKKRKQHVLRNLFKKKTREQNPEREE